MRVWSIKTYFGPIGDPNPPPLSKCASDPSMFQKDLAGSQNELGFRQRLTVRILPLSLPTSWGLGLGLRDSGMGCCHRLLLGRVSYSRGRAIPNESFRVKG